MDISPVQASAGWAVGWKKPEFWGRDRLLAEKEAGPARKLWGLVATDRGIPRAHMTVCAGDDTVGEITSGTFSPTRRIGIALALLDTAAGLGEGDTVEVDVRGKRAAMTVVEAAVRASCTSGSSSMAVTVAQVAASSALALPATAPRWSPGATT